mmetsp:Transcript_23729/g.76247  ORF Transcript_23729/g.76247 Transcript_23729/m.76247 type:complete len:212 (-) Transcript_23729:336-971(-)
MARSEEDEDTTTMVFLGRVEKVVGIEIVGASGVVEIGERQSIHELVEAICGSRDLLRDRLWTVRNAASQYFGPEEARRLKGSFAGAAGATVRSLFPSVGDVAFFCYDNFLFNHNQALCFRMTYEAKPTDGVTYPRTRVSRGGTKRSLSDDHHHHHHHRPVRRRFFRRQNSGVLLKKQCNAAQTSKQQCAASAASGGGADDSEKKNKPQVTT